MVTPSVGNMKRINFFQASKSIESVPSLGLTPRPNLSLLNDSLQKLTINKKEIRSESN